jgi:hypothetical protein
MSFTARAINSICSGEFRDSLKPQSIFCQGIGYRTDQSLDCDYRSGLGAGDAGFTFRAADVSCLQAQDGPGAHFARQARLRRTHFRMLHLPPRRETCHRVEKISAAVDPMKTDALGWLAGELKPPRSD